MQRRLGRQRALHPILQVLQPRLLLGRRGGAQLQLERLAKAAHDDQLERIAVGVANQLVSKREKIIRCRFGRARHLLDLPMCQAQSFVAIRIH